MAADLARRVCTFMLTRPPPRPRYPRDQTLPALTLLKETAIMDQIASFCIRDKAAGSTVCGGGGQRRGWGGGVSW